MSLPLQCEAEKEAENGGVPYISIFLQKPARRRQRRMLDQRLKQLVDKGGAKYFLLHAFPLAIHQVCEWRCHKIDYLIDHGNRHGLR